MLLLYQNYGIVFLFSTTYSLLVYQSNVPISEVTLSGLHLINEISPSTEFSGDLGACVRINYKRLAPTTSQAISTRVFSLGYPDLGDVPFIWIGANYPGSWLGVGTKNAYSSSWVIRELPNDYIIWSTSTWHHICLSFSKLRTFVTFVKVP